MSRLSILVISAGCIWSNVRAEPPDVAPARRAGLSRLVRAFFTLSDEGKRGSLARAIEKAASGSVPAVARAIRRAELWSDASPRIERFAVRLPGSRTVSIECSYPEGYDPAFAYPVLICLPHVGDSPARTLTLVRRALGESIRGFALASPARLASASFHLAGNSAGDFTMLLRELRRRIHIDSDRLFLFGSGTGGDAAWLAAMFHPDDLAGAIVLASYPHVPYAAQTLPFLLRNLRRVPVLTVWAEPRAGDTSLRRLAEVAQNRAIRRIADDADLPITSLEIASDRLDARGFLESDVRAILAGRRAAIPTEASLWFRYPQQGKIAWLRQTRFAGEVWEAPELSIRPAPGADRDLFITNTLQRKMAYLSGRIEGQTIDITARRCRRVELALREDLIDLTRPVTVRCNGKIRYEGLIEPDVATLLESAYADWDFQRPAVARFSFSIKRPRSR
ncbi:MAG: hypothetical protein IH989_07845 [Planctomycetes bacterium]|nr:hypothetical protein [Planctomycetota bacterium]